MFERFILMLWHTKAIEIYILLYVYYIGMYICAYIIVFTISTYYAYVYLYSTELTAVIFIYP